ncbi:hypothetical protein [Brevibacillus dissolubilis]|uniref:hypothetical protein n=1 Tax=Brevibacillus dissolubilis TaxID=1844116 RepID=UPI0021001361|nr:hypothetical protein [Brevibacillus dissolubilis]
MDAKSNVSETLSAMLRNWNQMAKSDLDEAEADADRFQDSFYVFITAVRAWFDGLKEKPADLDAALALPLIDEIVQQLPVQLYLPFETELDLMVEGVERQMDEKYD